MTFFFQSPFALPLRVLCLPVALPLIFLGVAMTDSVNPPANGPTQSFGSAVVDYILGRNGE